MVDNWIIKSFIGPKDQAPQAEGQELPIQPRSSETWRESFNRYLKLWSSSPDDSDPLSDQEPKDQSKGKGFNKKKAFLRLCTLGALSLLPLIAAENVGSELQVQDLSRSNKESGEICRPRNIFWPQCASGENMENPPQEVQDEQKKAQSEQEIAQFTGKIIRFCDALVQKSEPSEHGKIIKDCNRLLQNVAEIDPDTAFSLVIDGLMATQRELKNTQQELKNTQRDLEITSRTLKNTQGDLSVTRWAVLGTFFFSMAILIGTCRMGNRLSRGLDDDQWKLHLIAENIDLTVRRFELAGDMREQLRARISQLEYRMINIEEPPSYDGVPPVSSNSQ